MKLELTPDELLSTTRAVRKRLDLTRPVEREVLEECFQLAQQAPTASYSQNWHFVVVQDADKRKALAEIWREVAYPYLQRGGGAREGARSQTRWCIGTTVSDGLRRLRVLAAGGRTRPGSLFHQLRGSRPGGGRNARPVVRQSHVRHAYGRRRRDPQLPGGGDRRAG